MRSKGIRIWREEGAERGKEKTMKGRKQTKKIEWGSMKMHDESCRGVLSYAMINNNSINNLKSKES